MLNFYYVVILNKNSDGFDILKEFVKLDEAIKYAKEYSLNNHEIVISVMNELFFALNYK